MVPFRSIWVPGSSHPDTPEHLTAGFSLVTRQGFKSESSQMCNRCSPGHLSESTLILQHTDLLFHALSPLTGSSPLTRLDREGSVISTSLLTSLLFLLGKDTERHFMSCIYNLSNYQTIATWYFRSASPGQYRHRASRNSCR